MPAMKRLLLFLALGFVAGVAANLLLSRYCLPDFVVFREVAEASDAWAEQLRQQGRSCTVLAGGSEIRTGVDPAVMLEEFDLPVINAAENAGFGMRCNLVAALPYLRAGDTLVLSAINANGLDGGTTTAGLKFCFMRQGFATFSTGIVPLDADNVSSIMLGDVGPLASYVTRRLCQSYEKSYRYYSQTIIHPSGWMEVQHRRMGKAKLQEKQLTEADMAFYAVGSAALEGYRDVQALCRRMGVDFVVHIPVAFTSAAKRPCMAYQALQLTRVGIPVLRDERLGAVSDNSYFADTDLHPTDEGTKANSRILAGLIKDRRVWTEEELLDIIRSVWWQGTAPPALPAPAP